MGNDELAQSLPWREKVHENEYITRQDTNLSLCPCGRLLLISKYEIIFQEDTEI